MRDGESLSIENQKLIFRKYAEEHGFFNCKFYVDDGYSGASTERPAYKEMMNDVENERISTMIVKDKSRLGRGYLQTGLLMEITFPQYDVRFIAVNDGVDSINGVKDFAGIKNYFNDLYNPLSKTNLRNDLAGINDDIISSNTRSLFNGVRQMKA